MHQPSNSGSGDDDRLEFIRCVGGREPRGSVERLGVPTPSCSTGVAWTENILVPIRVEETDVTAKLGLTQLAQDLVSTAWMAGLINSGYNFRSEIPLVVAISEILLVV